MSRQVLRRLLWALSLACVVAISAAAPAEPRLRARPADTALTLDSGLTRIGSTAIAYRPRSLPPGPRPLVVLLHGAGADAGRFLDGFGPLADRNGYLLLGLRSADVTWALRPDRRGTVSFDPDAGRLDAALGKLFARAPVDRRRVVLLGFSDGASFGLSLGLANPELFRGIVALSPGAAVVPAQADAGQRVFIAHGRRDSVLPFRNVRSTIVPNLEAAGLRPRVRWFAGGHEIDRKALEEGLSFAIGNDR